MKKLVLFTLWCSWVYQDLTPLVCLKSGCVRGAIGPGGIYNQYLGIPYAYTDYEHRFKGPLPVKKWDGVLNAISEHVKCPQPLTTSILQGQENCLRVNVYTPTSQPSDPLPVMVFIHGGGFFEGSGNPAIYGPEYLVKKGVILVTLNYRLNVQGFLCLRTKDAPGNAGLKDQVAALKWVRENIRHFGGNQDDVTIFGESAGAASVSFHILSPMSTGLFHKAIIQSGSSLASWALYADPIASASILAETMGFESTNPYELYNYFINKSDSDLILTRAPRRKGNIIISELLFTPCVEKEIDGVETFLVEKPYDLLERGQFNKVPTMIGYNSEEGYLLANLEKDHFIKEITFKDSIPDNFYFTNETERSMFAEELHKIYLNNEEINKNTFHKFAKMYGHPHFDLPVSIETDFQLKHNKKKIFNYKFAYGGYLNVAKRSTSFKDQPGATHADDLFYMFKPSIIFTPARLLERKMVERITQMWTNFAKFGDPTPGQGDLPIKWMPTNIRNPEMLVLDEEFTYEPLWASKVLRVWKEAYSKFRRK